MRSNNLEFRLECDFWFSSAMLKTVADANQATYRYAKVLKSLPGLDSEQGAQDVDQTGT